MGGMSYYVRGYYSRSKEVYLSPKKERYHDREKKKEVPQVISCSEIGREPFFFLTSADPPVGGGEVPREKNL